MPEDKRQELTAAQLREFGDQGSREQRLFATDLSDGDRPAASVLYVLGAPRSGSSILGMLLAYRFDIVNVGEAAAQLAREVKSNSQCSCGLELLECNVWGEAIERLAQAHGFESAASFWNQLMRAPIGSGRLREFIDISALYRFVRESSAQPVVVDTSKSSEVGELVAGGLGSDLVFVHLVRDVRGVFWSRHRGWRRRLDSTRTPSVVALVRVALSWSRANLSAERVARRHRSHVVFLRYEDLTGDVTLKLGELADACGGLSRTAKSQAGSMSGREFENRHHSIAGNPVSRDTKAPVVRDDSEWMQMMPRWAQLLLFVLCYPLLRRYQYRL